ncbi:MAG: HAD-IA family hydrolase [Muribaculaceae bacterium]|nr:HAD-IA family hydrolase [Muribaculaceae bacterium]
MENILKGKKVALIDMDGVIYDSMKYHAKAWKRLMDEAGVPCEPEDIYIYEGMTGPAVINLLYQRAFGHGVSEEKAHEMYALKTKYFREIGNNDPMPGTDRMLKALERHGIRRVLVTGSSQASLIENINKDYPGAIMPGDRVTALDVTNGKPDPEPYLKGLAIAGVKPEEAIVIENAPLGVRAGKGAGVFTVAVTTGPVPREAFEKEGADRIFTSMPAFADYLDSLG